MKRLLLAGLIVAMLCPAALAEGELQLTQGTMQLGATGLQLGSTGLNLNYGGGAIFGIDMFMPEEGDSETGFKLGLSPQVGYFLMDNLELMGQVGLGMSFGDLYEKSDKLLSFGVGAKYHIPLGSMVAYAGLMVGMGFIIPDEGDTMKNFNLEVPLGILLPLNTHVAIDLGLKVFYTMGLDDQGSFLAVPIGYLGVQAFF
jgi:hypothetical protein